MSIDLFASSRALSVQSPAIPEVLGQAALVPLKLEGHEGINALFEYTLTLQTPDALNFKAGLGSNYALESFIGQEINCRIELEGYGHFMEGLAGAAGAVNQGAGVREINALITDARFLGEDSRHALYELTLRPWLHLATLTTDCKIFQDQTPVQVIDAVLADYPYSVEKRLIETYPVRDYCVQYNETDYEFISRLCNEFGINSHFEHSEGVHRLILSDSNSAFQPSASAAYQQIAYYPPGHKIDSEYLHAFRIDEQLTSGSYASRDYDYTRPKATLDASAQAPRNTAHSDAELYRWQQNNYSQPNAGADKAANQTEEQGQHLARLRIQAQRQKGHRAHGEGNIRGIAPGHSFTLTEHPQEAANCEYITLATYFSIENISEDTQRTAGATGALTGAISGQLGGALSALSDTQRLTGQWRILTRFDAQPSTEALRPETLQSKPRTHGPETALVTGPEGDTAESNIYTDQYGRIKVQFPWDRYGQKNQNSSCWVRVANAWAGNQLGAMHLPRIGQEVIIDFLGGDPDLPICTGHVYNQLNMPPWALPAQQALSGFRSRELTSGGGNASGGRSNHLVLDDTDQKIQAQLRSDHQHSQLSLGHITRIEDNGGRKDARGQGFELRTDGHGAVRANAGLLITTEGREKAQAHITDLAETVQRLTQASDQHGTQGDMAQQAKAHDSGDQAEVAKALKAQNQEIKGSGSVDKNAGSFPELEKPHLVLASSAGIATTSTDSTHQHSGEHHAITTGQHISLTAGKSLLASVTNAIRLFAYKMGIKLVSYMGDIDIQALQKNLNTLAKLDITMTAGRKVIIKGLDSILLNGGDSYIDIGSGKITIGSQLVQIKATLNVAGTDSMPVNLGRVPALKPKANQVQLEHLYHDNMPLAGASYEAVLSDGSIRKGKLDQSGQALLDDVPPGKITVTYGPMPGKYERLNKKPNPDYKPNTGESDIDALIDKHMQLANQSQTKTE